MHDGHRAFSLAPTHVVNRQSEIQDGRFHPTNPNQKTQHGLRVSNYTIVKQEDACNSKQASMHKASELNQRAWSTVLKLTRGCPRSGDLKTVTRMRLESKLAIARTNLVLLALSLLALVLVSAALLGAFLVATSCNKTSMRSFHNMDNGIKFQSKCMINRQAR